MRETRALVTCALEGCKRQKEVWAYRLKEQKNFFCCRKHWRIFQRTHHPWNISGNNFFRNMERAGLL